MTHSRTVTKLGVWFGLGLMLWGIASPAIGSSFTPSPLAASTSDQRSLVVAQATDVRDRLSFATFAGIFTVRPDGSDRQSISPPQSSEQVYEDLAWAPNRQWLGVVTNYNQVEIYTPATDNWQDAFKSSCFRPPDMTLTWTADSHTLLLRELCQAPASGIPGTLKLYISNDSKTEFLPLPLPENLQSDVYISPNGSQVAFVSGDHIYRMATSLGAVPQQLTTEPGVYSSGGSPLRWSPDGGQIAFYEGTYPNQQIHLMNADGSNPRLLTPDPTHQIYRSRMFWSPDGQYLAYYFPFDPPYSNQETVRLIEIDSGEIRQIARPGFYNALSWAPDSQRLVLSSGNYFEPQALFLYDLQKDEFTAITTASLTQILDVQWSIDSEWLAFTAQPASEEFGNQQLYTVRPDGSSFQTITTPEEYAFPFVWVP